MKTAGETCLQLVDSQSDDEFSYKLLTLTGHEAGRQPAQRFKKAHPCTAAISCRATVHADDRSGGLPPERKAAPRAQPSKRGLATPRPNATASVAELPLEL